ncbi:hypothetical protein [Actinospica durhamensis]|uniref:hypothetical protein n=1 Tax=Actinospica durhamensis TaxID=1508375 RepID=UPI001FEB963D|nr:hypothetical protein [Actinospica durhamensis]
MSFQIHAPSAIGSRSGSGSAGSAGSEEVGEGALARITSAIYSLLTVDVLLLLAVLPGLVPLVLLARDAADAPLAVACLIPVGPAVSAALFALRRHRGDPADLRPAAEFARGYRLNAAGVLKLWLPYLAVLSVMAVDLAHVRSSGVPTWWAAIVVVFAVAATLWMANALVITSLFSFRTRDAARLAAYFLGATRSVALGNLCLLIVAVGVVDIASEAVLALFGVCFAAALLRTAQPMIARVTKEFTA